MQPSTAGVGAHKRQISIVQLILRNQENPIYISGIPRGISKGSGNPFGFYTLLETLRN